MGPVSDACYVPRRHARLDSISVRDGRYAVRTWGSADGTPLLLLHGIQDTSATFQFLADALQGEYSIVAPDWRGHGGTRGIRASGWFHEYVSDLDILIDALGLDEPLALVGHSMGGNIATVFAALRPEKVRCVLSLDAFGVKPLGPSRFVESVTRWLHRELAQGRPPIRTVSSPEAMALALQRYNPRLPWGHALFLAHEFTRGQADELHWPFDVERRSIPLFHDLNEWMECWRRIRCPALWLVSSDPLPGSVHEDAALFASVQRAIGAARIRQIPGTSHNMHHDAPEAIAEVIKEFAFSTEAE